MRFHVIDAFADSQFAGNPAAVVPVPAFPSAEVMQAAAFRIGLPTTAFLVRNETCDYGIRWFTPQKEINLCGHATIASARHLLESGEHRSADPLRFVSPRGVLVARRVGDLIAVELPTARLTPCAPPPELLDSLGIRGCVSCVKSSDDVLVEVTSGEAVAAVRPHFADLARLPFRGHIVTARGAGGVDFVSRTFFPALGVDEDQVCVTAHCKLAPFWTSRLGQRELTAVQLSARGGRLRVCAAGERTRVLGTAVTRPGVHEVDDLAAIG